MKKTLVALCFAMCASFAFAQTAKMAVSKNAVKQMAKVEKSDVKSEKADYKGTIFTKENELMWCDFSTESGYTTGTLSNTDMVDGTNVTGHSQTAYHSQWRRIADTTAATCAALKNQGQYPATFNYPTQGYRTLSGLDSETPMAGLMVMTMQDQIAAWGGTGNTGNFNAYIAFEPFSTAGVPIVDVQFYQYYRKFNQDHCWIDYSTNGTTWYGFEINVRGVDIAVNSGRRGWLTTTMPLAIADQANVYLRLRWACSSNNGGAYGYLWIVDDFRCYAGENYRYRVDNASYWEGFYHMMPQGLNVPVVFDTKFRNTGANAMSNIEGAIYTFTEGQAATKIAYDNLSNLAVFQYDSLQIDPYGFIRANTIAYPRANPALAHGHTGFIPTTANGDVFVYADITSSQLDHVLGGGTRTFDTILVNVNSNANGGGMWGRDNGVLTKFSYWTYGSVEENVFSSSYEDVMWDRAGYGVYQQFITGDNVPAGWRIKGVQFVASTYPGLVEAGTNINAILYADYISEEDGNWYFPRIQTGASTHTITNGELNTLTNLEYEENGDYNVVTIEFLDQPELEANTSYYAGYQLPEDGMFCVAANSTGYYTLSDTSYVSFREIPEMYKYGRTFGIPNRGNVIITDAYDNSLTMFTYGENPMIRLLVGPYEYRPSTTISFECGEGGNIWDNTITDILCGTTDSVVIGSTRGIYVSPDEGFIIDKVYENGTEVFANNDNEEGDLNWAVENISAPVTVSATFKAHEVGINALANGVSVNLQPNPATSNVQLTINGVAGMVNVAIIDMSGRVISSQNVNAEATQNISLSNLAKGAYFVRITNNNFSKVEKLIVR